MKPSHQNINSNLFAQSNNYFVGDSNTTSQNHSLSGLPKSQEYEQFLLDDMSGSSQNPLAKGIFKNQMQSNISQKKDDFPRNTNDSQGTYAPSFNQHSAGKNQKINQIVSKFDKDLEKLMRLASNQPMMQQKKSVRKEALEKEQKNRQTMSRLSQQFFPKGSCQAVESGIKSKLKSRQTIGGFGFDKGRNRIQSNNTNEQNKVKTGPFDLISALENIKPQKMEIEQQSMNQNTQQNFMKTSQQQKSLPEKQNLSSATNQQNNPISFSQPVSLTKSVVQGRLSEVKRQRDRLSMGRDNLINFIRNMDEQEKKKEIKIQKHKQRVTIDFFNIIKFISQTDANQQSDTKSSVNQQNSQSSNVQTSLLSQTSLSSVPKQQKPSRRMTQFMKPLEPQKVIMEDERQDEFTPMKSYEQQKNKLHEQFSNLYDGSLIFGKQNIMERKKLQSQKKKTIDYQKYVFDEYLGKIKEKLVQQRKVVEDLRKQRQQIISQNASSIKQFNMTSKNLQQMQNQQQQLNNQINHLKQRLNPSDYLQYKKIINQFQLKFGIRLHRYDRIIKSQNSEGFYVQFTMDNLICRIKRNSTQEPFAIKFQTCLGLKNQEIYLTSFGYQWRTLIYSSFINKKLLKTTHFLSFIVNLAAYVQQLNQLQLSYDFISNMYDLRNPLINEVNMSLQFQLTISNNYEFLCQVDLLKLRQNEGVEVIKIPQNQRLQIPQDLLRWKKGTNKLLNSINFIIEYCHESMCRSTEKQIEIISNGSK